MSAAPFSQPTLASAPKPKRKPLLRLEVRDLSQSGSQAFLRLLSAATALEDAVDGVIYWLYKDLAAHRIPPTRSVTLILRSMPGVAYTTGRDIDDDHKEIHFSTDYISGIPEARQKEEMLGVIRHEMVHCWQWNALGSAPGGLIEGIADWVRLRSNFVPPHWKQETNGDWDAGYQHTGYFLEYLENRFGDGSVGKVNETLMNQRYEEEIFWKGLFGEKVGDLWRQYGDHLRESKIPETRGKASADGNMVKKDKRKEGDDGSEDFTASPEVNHEHGGEDRQKPSQRMMKGGGKIHIPRRNQPGHP